MNNKSSGIVNKKEAVKKTLEFDLSVKRSERLKLISTKAGDFIWFF